MPSLPATVLARGISVRTASVSCLRNAVRISANRLVTSRCLSPMRSPIASAFSSCCLASVRSPRSHSAQPRKYVA
jgi:hypothetical protein